MYYFYKDKNINAYSTLKNKLITGSNEKMPAQCFHLFDNCLMRVYYVSDIVLFAGYSSE